MQIPTSTFINIPNDFLSNIFGITGYILNNFWFIIELGLVFGFIGLVLSIIFGIIRR